MTKPTPPTKPRAKAGARHSAQDREMLQVMHDYAVQLGAQCGEVNAAKAANVAGLLESSIHANFTQLADFMFGQGKLTHAERIALSSAIGRALDVFHQALEEMPQLAQRSPDADAPPDEDAAPAADDTASDAATEEQGEQEAEFDNSLKAISKTADEFRVGNYIVLFGGRDLEGIGSTNKNADGSLGEYFSQRTQVEDATKSGQLPIDWEHATLRQRAVDGVEPGVYLGYVDWKTARTDERGVWVERVLDRRKKYIQWLEGLIEQGLISNSSEAHNVVKAGNGEILKYPLVRDTLTVQPMEPRMMTQNVLAALKALGYSQADIPQATSKGAASAGAAGQAAKSTTTGDSTMTPEEIAALVKKEMEAQAATAKAQAETEAQRKKEIDDAVQTALKARDAEWAKKNRLPLGGRAPHQARFSHLTPFDNYTPGDAALTVMVMKAAQARGMSDGPSSELLQYVGTKVAEGTDNISKEAQRTLKAIGIDPADMLDSAKANELNFTTQVGYGNEFVPDVWSMTQWELVRAISWVMDRLPKQTYTGPGDTFPIPLEGGDPVWYLVGQTTDVDATNRPQVSVGGSKIGTDGPRNMTMPKMGANVMYTGEMDEDPILRWSNEANRKLSVSYKEQMEHAVIDGDTATGASTNINHIAGTPTSTGIRRDLYLAFDGFRKLALVTNVANSLNAGGTLLDSHYLDVLWLMGVEGLLAEDPTKVTYILSPGVYKKIMQLASVKTRDVFEQATLETGKLASLWNREVNPSYFMHYKSATRRANTAGKVDQDVTANNTTGSSLSVRWDQWLMGLKRAMRMEVERYASADAYSVSAFARLGLIYRDIEAAAIIYNQSIG